MGEQSLVDLGPILQVMLLGLLLAMGPLAWVWLRGGASPGGRLCALTYLTLFLTFDLVLFGAFTRLTDSGLGCPDWPGCYGSASPVGAHTEISQAQAQLPSGPVTHNKAWIEMIHRYLATGVGVLILTLAVYSWAQRRRTAINPWWASFTLFWVCVQGAFGALTVTMKLFPAIVTLHLLGGMFLLALLQVQAQRYALAQGLAQRTRLSAKLSALLVASMAALWLQMALGAWVSTNYAVLACGSDFPTCQGSWWPRMNFAEGFELWRPLGQTPAGANVSLEALTAIHYVHRAFAYVVLALVAALAWFLWRMQGWQRSARWLAGLAALQLITGLSNVVLGWPLLAAVMHTGGAAALVLVTTTMAVHAWPKPQVQDLQSRPTWIAQESRL
jgi:heme a synthase